MKKTNKVNENKSITEYVRDDKGKIVSYHYEIFIRDKKSLIGDLRREEMDNIYRLYSYYGSSLTQRQISRFFPDLSLVDFRRILRAFNITKASSPFAPHMYEEKTEEELMQMQLREKESDFLRKLEEERIRNNEKLLKEYAQENLELKKKLEELNDITVSVDTSNFEPTYYSILKSDATLVLHLADLHIGAMVEGTYFKNDWDKEECARRLSEVAKKICTMSTYKTIVINLLGDHLDGMDQMTARRDHLLPQNMTNSEQINAFISVMIGFIGQLKTATNKIKLYCVKCGNHAGDFEYAANLALINTVKIVYPEIEATLFDTFFGYYKIASHSYLICHGKDPKYMKRPMPLNLNDITKVKLYEYLEENNITDEHIHVVKGDLHTENFNSCNKFDYRNVLSLFGSSDYCAYNYSKNQYGVSYDLIIGDNFMRGTFENI